MYRIIRKKSKLNILSALAQPLPANLIHFVSYWRRLCRRRCCRCGRSLRRRVRFYIWAFFSFFFLFNFRSASNCLAQPFHCLSQSLWDSRRHRFCDGKSEQLAFSWAFGYIVLVSFFIFSASENWKYLFAPLKISLKTIFDFRAVKQFDSTKIANFCPHRQLFECKWNRDPRKMSASRTHKLVECAHIVKIFILKWSYCSNTPNRTNTWMNSEDRNLHKTLGADK